MGNLTGKLRTALTGATIVVAGTVLGFVATQYQWPLAHRLNEIRLAFIEVSKAMRRPDFLSGPAAPFDTRTHRADELQPGLVMISGIDAQERSFIRVIDRDGNIQHEWLPDWFDMWPEPPAGVPANRLPNRSPAALLHGMRILDDGDVVVNWELLSTMRLSPCGEVRWKLENLGHHSVNLGEDDTIYVGAEIYKDTYPVGFENHFAPLNSYAIQQLDMDGNTLMYKEILEILRDNDLLGLMHLSARHNTETAVAFDTLHLNDVEVFPSTLPSQVFEAGDLMISLRNISTILVVDPDDWRVKFLSVGKVHRQHDPDFAPGDRIYVYDNRNMDSLVPADRKYSRIIELDARTGASRVAFQGEGPARFYGKSLGRQQKLANGNFMAIAGWDGRALEVNEAGDLVWEFFNRVDADHTGVITEAEILPAHMDTAFFAALRQECGQ